MSKNKGKIKELAPFIPKLKSGQRYKKACNLLRHKGLFVAFVLTF